MACRIDSLTFLTSAENAADKGVIIRSGSRLQEYSAHA